MRTKSETGRDLYIIVSKVTGSIKIGRSSNVPQRLNSLQTANSYELKVVLILEGKGDQERYFHQLCRKYRTQGEWFSLPCLSEIPLAAYEQIDLDALYDFIGN